MFSKLTNMFKNKKIWIMVLTTTLLLLPLVANAQAADAGALNATAEIQKLFSNLNILMLALQAFLWPILLLLGSLLNNDLLFSGGMETILLSIWTAVRDFVNIMFVLGLLAIAIANIMGLGSDKVALKTILPRIVIALIAVNFSFLACKVILDVVNVTTTAIFSIPMASDSLKKYSDPNSTDLAALSDKVCDKMIKQQAASGSTSGSQNPAPTGAFCTPVTGGAAPAPADGSAAPPAKYQLTDLGKAFFSTFNSRNAALIMAIELQNIVNIDQVNSNVADIKGLAINSIFSIIFFVIYATAFVALFAAMLIRVVVLWLTIAISPLTFLGFAFPSVKSALGENDPFHLFVSHALIPLKVSIVLTIGMIMISQLKYISGNSTNATDPASLGAITTGISTIQDLIAGLATAAFIWIATFEAFKGTKASGIVGKISGKVAEFGKTVARAPLYLPVLPGPGGSKVGLAALAAGGGLAGTLQQKFNEEDQRYIKLFGGKDAALKDNLSKAKTAPEAKKAIADYIVGFDLGGKDKGKQPEIAAKIKDIKELQNLKPPKGLTMPAFIDLLEKGLATQPQLDEFMANNQLEAPSLNKKPIVDAGKKASEEARKANSGAVPPDGKLAAAQIKLDAALKNLDKAKSPKEIKDALDAIEKATKEVNALKDSKSKIDDNIKVKKTDLDTSGELIIDKAIVGRSKDAYDQSVQASGDKDASRNMLIAKLKQSTGITDMDKLGKIADNIIAGNSSSQAPVPPVGGAVPPVPGSPKAPVPPVAPNPPVPPVVPPVP